MVRDIIDGPFTDLLRSFTTWFDDFAIVRRDDATRRAPPPKFFAVLGATARDLKEVPAPLETALWRAALRHTTPIPRDALARAVARARMDVTTDQAPRHARYGLIKAALNRNHRLERPAFKEIHPVSQALDDDHPHPAYHCGRVMAVLAALQYSALGDVGASVIQRYYASASTSPALVLGRLLRNAQFHLSASKMSRKRRLGFDKKIASVLSHIQGNFPANLTLEEQGLFALGYYHQQAHDRTKKTDGASDHATSTEQEPAS